MNDKEFSATWQRMMVGSYRMHLQDVKQALSSQIIQASTVVSKFGVAIAPQVIEEELSDAPFRTMISRIIPKTSVRFARMTFNHLKQGKGLQPSLITKDPFDQSQDISQEEVERQIQTFIDTQVAIQITQMTDFSKSEIARWLQQALEQGLTIDEAQDLIKRNWQVQSEYRARRIARTEILSASNKGSMIAAQSTGLNLLKKWDAFLDSRTRDSHVQADRLDPVPLDKAFVVGGHPAMHPGDPSLPADETIHCRCTLIYREIEA